MKLTGRFVGVFVFFILAAAISGCATKSRVKAAEQSAYLAGQNAAWFRQTQEFPAVTVLGPVQNQTVPWVSGLTLAQAVATANYLDSKEPSEIIITRQGESANLDANVLLNGVVVPLEPGDVIELRP